MALRKAAKNNSKAEAVNANGLNCEGTATVTNRKLKGPGKRKHQDAQTTAGSGSAKKSRG